MRLPAMPSCRNIPAGQLHRRLLTTLMALVINLLAIACGTTVPTPEPVRLTLAASSSAQPLARELANAYHAAFPHISVDLLPLANEAAALQAVLDGRADAALAAAPSVVPDGLAAEHIASDALAIVVHPDQPVGDLSGEQAQAVFSGRLRTWNQLRSDAGPDAIQVVTREQEAGPRRVLVDAVLGTRPMTPTAIVLPDDSQIRAHVGNDRDAIAVLPAGWLNQQVKTLTLDGRGPDWVAHQWPGYPLELPLFLLTSTSAAPDVIALRDYVLSSAGQQVVRQRYAPTSTQP